MNGNIRFQPILAEQKVYTAFPDTLSAKVHELDVADVSAKILMEDHIHDGKIYVLTEPEILTLAKTVEKISTFLKWVKILAHTLTRLPQPSKISFTKNFGLLISGFKIVATL